MTIHASAPSLWSLEYNDSQKPAAAPERRRRAKKRIFRHLLAAGHRQSRQQPDRVRRPATGSGHWPRQRSRSGRNPDPQRRERFAALPHPPPAGPADNVRADRWREEPCVSRARCMATHCRGSRPSMASIKGRRNNLAQASAEAGLPGSPSTKPCCAVPNQVGLPGRTAIFSTAKLKPQPHQGRPRMIMIADRGAADHHQQIAGAQALFRRACDGADIVFFHRQPIGACRPRI